MPSSPRRTSERRRWQAGAFDATSQSYGLAIAIAGAAQSGMEAGDLLALVGLRTRRRGSLTTYLDLTEAPTALATPLRPHHGGCISPQRRSGNSSSTELDPRWCSHAGRRAVSAGVRARPRGHVPPAHEYHDRRAYRVNEHQCVLAPLASPLLPFSLLSSPSMTSL